MLYKNYWLCYNNTVDESVCAILEEGFNPLNSRGLEDAAILVANTRELITIENYKIKNCRKYLDENGLFMGMFPPEFIEQELKKFEEENKKFLEKLEKESKLRYLERLKKPFYNERLYSATSKGILDIESLRNIIKKHNEDAFEKYGIIYKDEDYKLLFEKHNLIWE